MIRINLLGEKVDNSALYTLQAIAFACVLVLTAASCFVVYETAQASLESSQKEATLLESQLQKLRDKTKRVSDLEKNKNLLREKLLTIAKLKAKKSGPVQMLSDLTVAIPERAWLTAINNKNDGLELKGIAQDPQTVSLFMKNLETSKYFSGVELSFSKQKLRDGVAIQEYALLAKLRNPLELQGLGKAVEKISAEATGKKAKGKAAVSKPEKSENTAAVEKANKAPTAIDVIEE